LKSIRKKRKALGDDDRIKEGKGRGRKDGDGNNISVS